LVNCTDVSALLQGGVPSGYTVAPAAMSTTNGTTQSCGLSLAGYTPPTAVTFTGIAAGN